MTKGSTPFAQYYDQKEYSFYPERKLKLFHLAVSESSWSVLVRRIRRGELKTLHLTFTDTDWSLVVRTVKLGQERHVIRTSLASILSHLEKEQEDGEVNTASINSAKQEVAALISKLTRPEDLSESNSRV